MKILMHKGWEITQWLVMVTFAETKRKSKITANRSKVTEVRVQGKRVRDI